MASRTILQIKDKIVISNRLNTIILSKQQIYLDQNRQQPSHSHSGVPQVNVLGQLCTSSLMLAFPQ